MQFSFHFHQSSLYIADSHKHQKRIQCYSNTVLFNHLYSLTMSNNVTFSIFLFFLILCSPTYGRFITHRPLSSSSSSPYNLISDGVHDPLFTESSTCEQTYGFLPCTTTVMGNIFLIAVYGYFMFLAASYLSYGSELLMEILGPGIVGGLFLPILGTLPDAMLILGTHFSLLILFFFCLVHEKVVLFILFLEGNK